MANLNLKGRLNLKGNLTLQGASGGKVTVDDAEALVEAIAPADPQHGTAPPVNLPPPPAGPVDPGPKVWVINSFNRTVKAGTKVIVAQGLVMQGNVPTWPGMVLPSQNNKGPVSINFLPINVVEDQAVIFPSGGTATFSASGQ
ncbi:MAG: hypothetical protein F6K19_50755 [Cyanothece sp. SIO1E1]|nr:hypothetical protein [Cyanothece sp. SIO1E1]